MSNPKFAGDLRRLEASISCDFETGYDPYNSVDRFNVYVVPWRVTVEEPTAEDKARRCSPRITLHLPAGLIALGAKPLAEFAPDEFTFEPPLGPGPLSPQSE